jgi:hypothetical protein
MFRMQDLGAFGDARRQKGGPIFWRHSLNEARCACVSSAVRGLERCGSAGFCTMQR